MMGPITILAVAGAGMLASLSASTSLAQKNQLPPPPKGYAWEWCEDIKGAFLRPEGWFFKQATKKDTLGYFVTKEKIGESEGKSGFLTGLTVNVLKNIPQKKSMSPYRFALAYRESARQTETFSKEWDKDMGPFKSVGFVFTRKNQGDKAGAFTVHNLLIANEKTGTLYLILFEAPAAEWEDAWTVAEPMLRLLYIDDSI